MGSSGDMADRFSADPVTPGKPHDPDTRIALHLQGNSPEEADQADGPVAEW